MSVKLGELPLIVELNATLDPPKLSALVAGVVTASLAASDHAAEQENIGTTSEKSRHKRSAQGLPLVSETSFEIVTAGATLSGKQASLSLGSKDTRFLTEFDEVARIRCDGCELPIASEISDRRSSSGNRNRIARLRGAAAEQKRCDRERFDRPRDIRGEAQRGIAVEGERSGHR